MMDAILLALSLDCSASFCIWLATTANPRPCSPALAASIEALRDSRLVSSAISVISAVASRIRATDSLVVLVCSYIRSMAPDAFLLIRSSLSRVSTALLPASRMASEILIRSLSCADVSSTMLPMRITFSVADWVSSACDVAPSDISAMAWLT